MVAADTIVATATPFGVGGIAVVRLDGPEALGITRKICGSELDRCPTFAPRVATLATIHSQHTATDEGIVTWFQAPNSYTGGDVVEISCHGSPTITETIIEEACRYGARIAEPGEFTQRAFLNGRLDLIQAESVAALINSRTTASSQLNYRLLHGQLSELLYEIRNKIINNLALVEFELDISEDEQDPALTGKLTRETGSQITALSSLVDSYQQGKLINRGANVVIAGAPNVGKSTLLNTLSDSDRAIVSNLPGTTRDTIDIPLIIGGVLINLIDTAGLRSSSEEIEQEGIRRTRKKLVSADLIIAVYEPPAFDQDLDLGETGNKPLIRVHNKTDLLDTESLGEPGNTINISAKTGSGIKTLKTRILETLKLDKSTSSDVMLTSSRQLEALTSCREKLMQAQEILQTPSPALELLSVEYREAIDSIDRLLGKTTADDIINHIFGSFCVGK